MDARDAGARNALLWRFADWCVWNGGWWSWDMSWMATTYFGSKGRDAVERWARPFCRAFVAGAWFLVWTPETLFWIAKPEMVYETAAGTPRGKQLHCDDGPALVNDVENLYYIHGVQVPADVVLTPHLLTVKHIDAETNNDVRGIMLERFGRGRYLTESGAEVVDEGRNDIEGTHEALMRTPNGRVFFWPTCPSGRVCPPLPVPDEIATRQEARDWLAGGSSSRIVART